MNAPVLKIIDFRVGDIVEMPSGRMARVRGFLGERVDCVYMADGGEVLVFPHLLKLVGRPPAHPVPARFMAGVDAVRERREV